MKKHKHLFFNIGGGCFLKEHWRCPSCGSKGRYYEDEPCNDKYRCKCGKEIKIYSSYKRHFKMPRRLTEKQAEAF